MRSITGLMELAGSHCGTVRRPDLRPQSRRRVRHFESNSGGKMKLRHYVAFALVFTVIAGCTRQEPETAPTPETVSDVNTDRAQTDSIAAAELARRQAEDGDRRARLAQAQETLSSVVFFEYDTDVIDAEAEDQLRIKSAILRANPSLEVRVEGHADERGSTEYNLALGQRRAEAVRTFLSGYGITPNRLTTISYGKERPAVEGSDESTWARNRRAEFAITGGEISAIPPEIR
ncbi:MAG: peptidoglycan-associated lipoprotein Pal [Gemmatimonas sp.]|nr:peptidoglycan-associated lipoprotein Pal [Gemmatimonas sp.]